MKIAEIVATFPPCHGGMGYVCLYNSRELARRGHDVTVFTLDHGVQLAPREPEGLKVVRLGPMVKYGDAGMVPQLFSRLKNFDVIHLHYPFFGGAEYVYLASLLRRQPYFLTYHMDVQGNTPLKRAVIGVYEPFLLKRIMRRASLIGALNFDHLRNSKVARLIDWERVVELPNGVDAEQFQPREKNRVLVEKYRLEGKTVVLFVGNLQPYKGLHLLIEAVAGIRDTGVILLVVGGGYSENEYKEMVKEKNLGNRVIFVGPVPHEGLPDYYSIGDFLVLPSTYSESFGLVVLEALASGKAAIISALPGPAQLIDDGKDGFIVRVGDVTDLKNKIEHLAKEKGARENMGVAARKKVIDKYSWEKIGCILEDQLLTIVDKTALSERC